MYSHHLESEVIYCYFKMYVTNSREYTSNSQRGTNNNLDFKKGKILNSVSLIGLAHTRETKDGK